MRAASPVARELAYLVLRQTDPDPRFYMMDAFRFPSSKQSATALAQSMAEKFPASRYAVARLTTISEATRPPIRTRSY